MCVCVQSGLHMCVADEWSLHVQFTMCVCVCVQVMLLGCVVCYLNLRVQTAVLYEL